MSHSTGQTHIHIRHTHTQTHTSLSFLSLSSRILSCCWRALSSCLRLCSSACSDNILHISSSTLSLPLVAARNHQFCYAEYLPLGLPSCTLIPTPWRSRHNLMSTTQQLFVMTIAIST